MAETTKTIPVPLQHVKPGDFFRINDGFCYSAFAYQKCNGETIIVYKDGSVVKAPTSNIIYIEPPMGTVSRDYSITNLSHAEALDKLEKAYDKLSKEVDSIMFPLSSIANGAKKLYLLEQRIELLEKSPELIDSDIPIIKSRYFAVEPKIAISTFYLSSDNTHTESEVREVLINNKIYIAPEFQITAIPETQKFGAEVIERCKTGRGGPGRKVEFIPLEQMCNDLLRYII